MRWVLALIVIAACNDGAIDLKLALPKEDSTFDLSCVKAVDVLTLGPNDAMPLDIGARTSNNVACVDLDHSVTTIAQLQAALANKVDAPIPAGGLAAVEIRGRAGTCAEKPAQYEAIFYGGAVDTGNADLTIPLVRNISCGAGVQYTVKPVNMYDLFTTKACADYVDPGAQAVAGDFRPTLITRQPMTFETGQSSQPMSAATALLSTFSQTSSKSCAAISLQKNPAGSVGGQACINNAGGATACANSNVELALLPTAYAQMSRDTSITKYGAWSFVGVWTTTGTVGPVSGATVTLDPNDDAKIVYGDLGTTAFVPSAGATATTASGMIMIYANALVTATITAPGKGTTKLRIAADPTHPSSAIAVIN